MQAFATLPGVQADLALSRLGGNLPLYRQILAVFARSHARTVDEIAQALQAGRLDAALRLSHTLKGATATLGAMALAQRFEDLEAAIQAGDAARAHVLAQALGPRMASLVTAIDALS